MNNEVLDKHYLKVLVELDLYPKLRCLSEGTKISNLDEAREELIKDFIESLSSKFKKIDGYKEIIFETITKLEKKDKERKEEER